MNRRPPSATQPLQCAVEPGQCVADRVCGRKREGNTMWRTIGMLGLAATMGAMSGCAPDAWSNKQATGLNAFLNQIATQCAPLQLGRYNMSGMILRNDIGSTDAYNYFFDQTSRLYF